ncbi:hypothetical protein [Fulvivirga ligni]|uniref:hypothetical protein n=1 Tax=Fulvivirga ligni TaxID=2904246 RepID=UPI001F2B8956|nr:hypothetical protein [Fulvivirga ligni]UII19884.1 hypothetical protein LVD16_18740 [Fulvivirga ligni]
MPINSLLSKIEKDAKRSSRRRLQRFFLRGLLIKCKVFILAKSYNKIEADRQIVKLLAYEIYKRGDVPESFVDQFYEYLEKCREDKDEEEFKILIDIWRNPTYPT